MIRPTLLILLALSTPARVALAARPMGLVPRSLQEAWSGFPGPQPPNTAMAETSGQQAAAFASASSGGSGGPAPAEFPAPLPQQQAYAAQPALQQVQSGQQQFSTYAMQQEPQQVQLVQQAQPLQGAPQVQQPQTQQPQMQQPQMQQQYQPAGAPQGLGSSGLNMAAVLELHNRMRARHGTPPLASGADLASSAQAWADRCVFQHSGGGENLAQYFPSPIQAVQAWYSEVSMYSYGSDYSAATGHATQMLWRSSTSVGCGYAPSCQLLVCHYSPPGNVIGHFAENVSPPVA